MTASYRFQEIHVELTTSCNFLCDFCPLTDLQRPKGKLDLDTVKDVLRQCIESGLTDRATFHLMGEALLYRDCMAVLEHCKELGIRTRLVTNGSLYSEEKYLQLYSLLEILDISFRSVDDIEMQRVTKKFTFEEYLSRIVEAIRLRERVGGSTNIRIRLFVSERTQDSIRQLAAALNIPETSISDGGHGLVHCAIPWLTFLREYELDWVGKSKRYPSYIANCEEFETGFAVLASGDVTTCCWDAHGGNKMGNVHEQPLAEILFGRKATDFRASFKRHICPTETCRMCLGRPNLYKSIGYQALALVQLR